MTLAHSAQPLGIVIDDDHPLVRRGLADVIGDERDMRVVSEASTTAEALSVIVTLQPSVAVVDLWLGSGSGLDLVQAIARDAPGVAVWCCRGTTSACTPSGRSRPVPWATS